MAPLQYKRGMKRRKEKLKDGDEAVIHWHSKDHTKEEEWWEGGHWDEGSIWRWIEGVTQSVEVVIIERHE